MIPFFHYNSLPCPPTYLVADLIRRGAVLEEVGDVGAENMQLVGGGRIHGLL